MSSGIARLMEKGRKQRQVNNQPEQSKRRGAKLKKRNRGGNGKMGRFLFLCDWLPIERDFLGDLFRRAFQ